MINERESFRTSLFEEQQRLPDQIWYDELRSDDDGSYAFNISHDFETDYQHRKKGETRHEYLRRKLLSADKGPSVKPVFNATSRNYHYSLVNP